MYIIIYIPTSVGDEVLYERPLYTYITHIL